MTELAADVRLRARRPRSAHPAAALALLIAACAAPPPPSVQSSGPEGALDWTIGDWIGVRRDLEDDSAAPMTMQVRAILGRAGHTHDLRVELPDAGVYLGFAVDVFDPASGTWHRSYVNAVRRTFVRLDGVVLDADRSEWRTADPSAARRSRLVSERLDGGLGWRRTMYVSDAAGVPERPLWRDELRREGRD